MTRSKNKPVQYIPPAFAKRLPNLVPILTSAYPQFSRRLNGTHCPSCGSGDVKWRSTTHDYRCKICKTIFRKGYA